jgi:gamma-glutamyl-gamma-aminobutyrate hydrolase PuuD
MARLKDVNYSQSGGEDSIQQVRNIEEAQIAMHEAPSDTGLSYKVFKLTDTGKKGKYHMEGIDDVWDPDKKKMVRIRLLRGFPSIYMEDQKNLEPQFISSNRRSLVFDARILRVPDYDTSAIEFLQKCNSNVDNPNKKGTRKLTFFEWNPQRQAEVERKKRLDRIEAIKFARENNIPYLGICLGMQLSIIEYLRNVVGIKEANSIEFDKDTSEPAIYLIEQFLDTSGNHQIRTHTSPMGGTMRLGGYPFEAKAGSILEKAYGKGISSERHRHRYEANPKYKEILEKAGMVVTGESNGLIEVVEIPSHKWFVGVQFHPEFKSSLQTPNPIILAFVEAGLNSKNS